MDKLYLLYLIEDARDARSAFRRVQEIMAGSVKEGVEVCEELVGLAGIAFNLEVGTTIEEVYAQVRHTDRQLYV